MEYIICTKCKIEKPIILFGVNRQKKNGRRSWCLDCDSEKNRENSKNKHFRMRAEKIKKRVNGYKYSWSRLPYQDEFPNDNENIVNKYMKTIELSEDGL